MLLFKEICLNNNASVFCSTKDNALNYLTWASSKGMTWEDGSSLLDNLKWTENGRFTCYFKKEDKPHLIPMCFAVILGSDYPRIFPYEIAKA